MEKITKLIQDLWEAPGKILKSLDPEEGHGPEDMGGVGTLGSRMADEMKKNPDKIFYN